MGHRVLVLCATILPVCVTSQCLSGGSFCRVFYCMCHTFYITKEYLLLTKYFFILYRYLLKLKNSQHSVCGAWNKWFCKYGSKYSKASFPTFLNWRHVLIFMVEIDRETNTEMIENKCSNVYYRYFWCSAT